VAKGSGRAARIPGIDVAGKTGTAQTPDAPDHNWFIGFAPAGNPKIAVAVFVRNGGGTGGDVSAPIAHDVIQAYLQGQGG
jgi:peptidoglycan glycosyltransferase